jgi:hypothetical protein
MPFGTTPHPPLIHEQESNNTLTIFKDSLFFNMLLLALLLWRDT